MSKRRNRPYRGVTAAVGLPGSGKSYYLVEKVLEAQRRGIPTYSNAGFDVKGTETIGSFRDLVEVQGPAVIAFDELPLFFNARRWQTFPDGMLYKLTQIRKDQIELYYSTINPKMVDITLRHLTFEWVWCRHIYGRLMRRIHKSPEEWGGDRLYTRFVWRSKEVEQAYDTLGRVAVHDAGLPTKVSDERFVMPDLEDGEGDDREPGGPRLRVPGPVEPDQLEQADEEPRA